MADYPAWLAPLLGFIFGLQFGSFITLVSFRLPEGKDVIVTPSQCPHCHHRLSILDLFPVVSWVLSRRCCRYCKAPVSARYPIIELIAGGCGALLCITTPPLTFLFIAKALAMIYGGCAAVMVCEHRRIPVFYMVPYAACLIVLCFAIWPPLMAVGAMYVCMSAFIMRKRHMIGLVLSAPCVLVAAYLALGWLAVLFSGILLGVLVAVPRTRAHSAEGVSHMLFVLFIALTSIII